MDNFIERMAAIYDAMDRDYDSVARHYGFSCEGCEDNCCTQRFFHYTMAEYLYLLKGLQELDPGPAGRIVQKARDVVAAYEEEKAEGRLRPLMCPVNFDGLCALYSHRPMICRLHGLPHRFTDPHGVETRGGGCPRFDSSVKKTDWTLKRTPHYSGLARIEGEMRSRQLIGRPIRFTTAEMLVMMADTDKDLQECLKNQAT
jgi:Fe-S-cluster containining protein